MQRGDRIAQLVVAPVARATWREVDDLAASRRAATAASATPADESPRATEPLCASRRSVARRDAPRDAMETELGRQSPRPRITDKERCECEPRST